VDSPLTAIVPGYDRCASPDGSLGRPRPAHHLLHKVTDPLPPAVSQLPYTAHAWSIAADTRSTWKSRPNPAQAQGNAETTGPGLLKRLSQRLGRGAVATVLEEAPSIARRHRVEGSTHRFYERIAGTRPGSAQQRLKLGESLLDGVEIGRVRR
jgi:hypothetical protein